MTDPRDAEIARLRNERQHALDHADAAIEEIARLTRERDEAPAKVAAAFEASIAAIEGSRIVGGIVGPNDAGFEDGLSEAQAAIRALTPADATAALNRVRAGAMREAAGICMREDIGVTYECCHDAILARADAVERGE